MNSEVLASAFHHFGHEVHLITWTKKKGEKAFPFQVKRTPGLCSLLREHYWADIVYENNPTLRLSWPAIFFNKPSVVALRTWINRPNGKTGLQDRVKKHWLGRAAAVIAVSVAIRNKVWPPAIVIGNPYRADVFKVLPNVRRSKTFVFLGRLVSDKGADLAIKAFEELLPFLYMREDKAFQPSLTIIGDGPQRTALENLVTEAKVKHLVTFTGSLEGENLVYCLNQHRFMIVPSRWEEPFGNVALEGMACGCVPIVSDGGGLPDAVGEAGITFERGSVESLVNAIRDILSNQGTEDQLRDVASIHLSLHHPKTIATKYLAVLKTAYNLKR